MTRAAQLLEDVEVDLGRGASVRVGEALKQQCSVSASVTVKKGRRALYYDIDVHATWIAEPPQDFDLSPDDAVQARDRPRSLEGTVRLYNVSHETKYQPGADTNVAYMYQLGAAQRAMVSSTGVDAGRHRLQGHRPEVVRRRARDGGRAALGAAADQRRARDVRGARGQGRQAHRGAEEEMNNSG